jgi:hypothetical protein
MKGRSASTQAVATQFVIVVGDAPYVAAYMSPRGKAVFSSCNRWTLDPDKAHIYPSWMAADRAISRMVKGKWLDADKAKYCTFGEFIEMRND